MRLAVTSNVPMTVSGQMSVRSNPPRVRSAAAAITNSARLVIRMAMSVIIGEDFAPWSTATKTSPKHTPANAASCTERPLTRPDSSGPLVAMAPASATTRPTVWSALGTSPRMKPIMTGTLTPSAAIGETTPIVPLASAQ